MKTYPHHSNGYRVTFDFKNQCPPKKRGGLRIFVWLSQRLALRLLGIMSIALGFLGTVAALGSTTLI